MIGILRFFEVNKIFENIEKYLLVKLNLLVKVLVDIDLDRLRKNSKYWFVLKEN